MLKKYLALGSALLCLAVVLTHALTVAHAQQTVITVNDLADTSGNCSPGSTNCTLRTAVEQAVTGALLTIRFAENICGAAASCEIVLTREIVIPNFERHVVIEGLGWNILAISGASKNRLLNVGDQSSLTLKKLHLKDGNADFGGAIFVRSKSQLKVIECRFTSNRSSKEGGAIAIDNGAAIIENSLFESNSVINGKGGAISIY